MVAVLEGRCWSGLAAALAGRLDLEGSAVAHRALLRRRGVADASVLLRLALAYGGTDLSLRGTAAWARAAGVADLSDVALMYRLQGAESWLGDLLQTLLSQEVGALAADVGAVSGWRLRLVDGTSIAGAFGKGYHLHAGFDLGARRFDRLELTGGRESESLARFDSGPGEILIADRFYAKAKGLRHVIAQGGHVVIRRGLTSCRVLDEAGKPLDAKAILALAEAGTADDQVVDHPMVLPGGPDEKPLPVRLIIQRKPPDAAERARRHAAEKARSQRYRAKPRQLEASRYLILMTSLPIDTMAAARILALYRLRCQIETAFKRLKSLGGLEKLQAKEPRLATAAIFAKLILAIVAESLLGHVLALSPSASTLDLAPHPTPP